MNNSYWFKVLGIGSWIVVSAFASVKADLLPLQLVTTLKWSASSSQNIAGYAVYYSLTGLPVTTRVDAGNSLTATLPLLVGTDYSFYVVAYNAEGAESLPSNTVNYTPPPITRLKLNKQGDGTIRLQFRTVALAPCRVEYTSELSPLQWQTLGSAIADLNGDVVMDDSSAGRPAVRFYRAVKL